MAFAKMYQLLSVSATNVLFGFQIKLRGKILFSDHFHSQLEMSKPSAGGNVHMLYVTVSQKHDSDLNKCFVLLSFFNHSTELEDDLSLVSCDPQLAYLLSQCQYFVCPVGFNSETNSFTVECEPSEIFLMQEYTLPAALQNILTWVRLLFHSF